MKDLDIRPDTIKLLEENIGQTLSDINDSNIFLDPPLRVMTVKTKINKWDLIKLKSLCTAKETLNKMQRQPTEWEKIFASESTDKGFISKIYIQLLQLHTKKSKQPHQKMGGRSKQTVLQKRHTDGRETHEKMFSVTHYERNANQNHDEVPPYTSQKGHHPKVYKQ